MHFHISAFLLLFFAVLANAGSDKRIHKLRMKRMGYTGSAPSNNNPDGTFHSHLTECKGATVKKLKTMDRNYENYYNLIFTNACIYAIRLKDPSIFDMFVEEFARVGADYMIIEAIEDGKKDGFFQPGFTSYKAFRAAAENSNIYTLRLLKRKFGCKNAHAALKQSIMQDRVSVVKWGIDDCEFVKSADTSYGFVPSELAVEQGSWKVLELLLDEGERFSKATYRKYALKIPLHRDLESLHVKMYKRAFENDWIDLVESYTKIFTNLLKLRQWGAVEYFWESRLSYGDGTDERQLLISHYQEAIVGVFDLQETYPLTSLVMKGNRDLANTFIEMRVFDLSKEQYFVWGELTFLKLRSFLTLQPSITLQQLIAALFELHEVEDFSKSIVATLEDVNISGWDNEKDVTLVLGFIAQRSEAPLLELLLSRYISKMKAPAQKLDTKSYLKLLKINWTVFSNWLSGKRLDVNFWLDAILGFSRTEITDLFRKANLQSTAQTISNIFDCEEYKKLSLNDRWDILRKLNTLEVGNIIKSNCLKLAPEIMATHDYNMVTSLLYIISADLVFDQLVRLSNRPVDELGLEMLESKYQTDQLLFKKTKHYARLLEQLKRKQKEAELARAREEVEPQIQPISDSEEELQQQVQLQEVDFPQFANNFVGNEEDKNFLASIEDKQDMLWSLARESGNKRLQISLMSDPRLPKEKLMAMGSSLLSKRYITNAHHQTIIIFNEMSQSDSFSIQELNTFVLAAELGFIDPVIDLLKRGLDPNKDKGWLLNIAVVQDNPVVFDYLLKHAKIEKNIINKVVLTVIKFGIPNMETLLTSREIDVNFEHGRFLMYSVNYHRDRYLDFLIKHGANVNAEGPLHDGDPLLSTPLSIACADRNIRYVEKILNHGANVAALDNLAFKIIWNKQDTGLIEYFATRDLVSPQMIRYAIANMQTEKRNEQEKSMRTLLRRYNRKRVMKEREAFVNILKACYVKNQPYLARIIVKTTGALRRTNLWLWGRFKLQHLFKLKPTKK